jgi:hypothetical protein
MPDYTSLPGGLIAAAVLVLPVMLITAVVGLVALVAVCSPSQEARAHSLQVLDRLTAYARAIRSRR